MKVSLRTDRMKVQAQSIGTSNDRFTLIESSVRSLLRAIISFRSQAVMDGKLVSIKIQFIWNWVKWHPWFCIGDGKLMVCGDVSGRATLCTTGLLPPQRMSASGWVGTDFVVNSLLHCAVFFTETRRSDIWTLAGVVLDCHIAALQCANALLYRIEDTELDCIQVSTTVNACTQLKFLGGILRL